MSYYYGFTIKCNKKGIGESIAEINTVLGEIFSDPIMIEITEYEKDTKDKQHAHGVIKSPDKILYKNHCKKGWHIYIRRIYENTGWMRYVQKDLYQFVNDN